MTRGNAARISVGVAVSAVLLALLLKAVDPAQLVDDIRQSDWRLLLPATALYFVGVWVRSIRWSLLLPRETRNQANIFRALIVGFTVNNVVPIRLGEIGRAYLLARWDGVPYGSTIASIVVERILDGLTLSALLVLGMLFVSPPAYLVGLAAALAAVFVGGAIGVAIAAWRTSALVAVAAWVARWLPARLGLLLVRLAEGFAGSLGVIRGVPLLLTLAGLSLVAWMIELSVFWLLMLAFPIQPSFADAAIVGTLANFATAIPSSPGYVGTFDGAIVRVLGDLQPAVSTGVAAAYALVLHAVLFIPVTLVGIAILWRANLSLGELTRGSRASLAPSAAE